MEIPFEFSRVVSSKNWSTAWVQLMVPPLQVDMAASHRLERPLSQPLLKGWLLVQSAPDIWLLWEKFLRGSCGEKVPQSNCQLGTCDPPEWLETACKGTKEPPFLT